MTQTAATAAPPLAAELAGFAARFDLAGDPRRDLLAERAKLHVLDAIGIALAAGWADDEFARRLARTVEAYGSAPQCAVIGSRLRAAAPLAAFANGSLVHGCDYDDVYYERTVHTEGVAVPPVLAIAERDGLGGAAAIEAWVVATELCLRMACGCASVESLYDTGFHTTAIFGSFGAAGGGGKALGLGEAELTAALSLAASFASGTAAGWNEESGRNKSLQPGWASLNGLHAAQLAATGYTCSPSTVDGPTGLYFSHSWRHGWRREDVVDGLGEEWKLLDLAFKLHPAGGMIQSTIDATRKLVSEHRIEAAEVEAVEVVVPAQFAKVLDELIDGSYVPDSGYTMFCSWPCNVARTILTGHVGLEHLTDAAIREPELLALAARVRCRADDDTATPPADRATTVTIATTRGTYGAAVGRHGGHRGPDTGARVTEKFRRNAALRLPRDTVAAIEDAVMRLDELDDVRELMWLVAAD